MRVYSGIFLPTMRARFKSLDDIHNHIKVNWELIALFIEPSMQSNEFFNRYFYDNHRKLRIGR
jgi:hypothetical protein